MWSGCSPLRLCLDHKRLRSDGLTGSYSGPDLGSQRTGHIQFGRRPLRRLHCVSAEREGTPEVHGKMDLSRHMLFQSVRLVGAVGIENDPKLLSPAISRRCNRLPNPIADSADSKPASDRDFEQYFAFGYCKRRFLPRTLRRVVPLATGLNGRSGEGEAERKWPCWCRTCENCVHTILCNKDRGKAYVFQLNL